MTFFQTRALPSAISSQALRFLSHSVSQTLSFQKFKTQSAALSHSALSLTLDLSISLSDIHSGISAFLSHSVSQTLSSLLSELNPLALCPLTLGVSISLSHIEGSESIPGVIYLDSSFPTTTHSHVCHPIKRSRGRLDVWLHFSRIENEDPNDQRATCNYCEMMMNILNEAD
ncbi:hypothetical protein F2P56_022394 [Juglans regia]|uniref:Uncharacterized protein n=1 Tax=Juglans regia TaxID=51240 RepID=A0A833X3Q1_JUGRE|nr:hypothetical protein F2P56_022394 [Juglans regia]